jgi:hypothetical protein
MLVEDQHSEQEEFAKGDSEMSKQEPKTNLWPGRKSGPFLVSKQVSEGVYIGG